MLHIEELGTVDTLRQTGIAQQALLLLLTKHVLTLHAR